MTGRGRYGEAVVAGVLAAGAVIAAVLMLAGLLRDVATLGLEALRVGAAALGVLAVVLLAASRGAGPRASARARTVTLHSAGGGPLWATRLHEAGHVVMTRRLGGFVKRVTVNADGSGLTEAVFPPWVDLGAVEELAMDHAGALAEGIPFSAPACAGDRRSAHATLRRVPWTGRGWVDRKGRSIARRTVGPGLLGPRGSVARVARGLPSPGTRRFRR